MIYTVKQAAQATGISATTVRAWSGRFRAHMSDGVNPPGQGQRQYQEDDIGILRTIKFLRDNQQTWEFIREALDNDERYMPDTAETRVYSPPLPDSPASQALAPLDLLERFMRQMEDSNAARIEAEKRAAAAEARVEMLQEQLAELKGHSPAPSPAETTVVVQPQAPPPAEQDAQEAAAQQPVSGAPPPGEAADPEALPAEERPRTGLAGRIWRAWVELVG